jgi:uncharacterized SAM-binding protein YcdF (DUF218 family)
LITARSRKPRRFAARAFLIGILTLLIATIAAIPYAGRFLVIDEPLEPADAILILAGPRTVRWLEGVDLYRSRLAPQVVISPGIVEAAEVQLRARGIRYPAEADLATDAMVQLGVPAAAISRLPGSVDNTADEAAQMRTLALARGWKRLIVVTSKYHTRRTRFAFAREFRGTDIRVQVRGSRYDGASPDDWWKHRSDLRYVVSELQKLVAYQLGLSK